MRKQSILCILVLSALGGCAADRPAVTDETESELRVGRTFQIQSGAKLVVLGVTDDGHALYWDNGNVYATRLVPGASRQLVAAVGNIQPLVLVSGRVALIWTTQPFLGAAGVSPLVAWTASGGPQLVSSASFAATGGTAISPDSREIAFISNVSADGTVGDLVSASPHLPPSLSPPRTLVAGVNVNFAGRCFPSVGFDKKPTLDREEEHDHHAHPVAAYCKGSDTTATLTRWDAHGQLDLATGLRTPLWTSDADGTRFFAVLANNRTPIVVDAHGVQTVLQNVPMRGGWNNPDGAIIGVANTATGSELQRITLDPAPRVETLAPVPTGGFLFQNNHAQGFTYYDTIPTSRNGKLLLGANAADPNTGLSDIHLLDISQTPAKSVVLQATPTAVVSFELFTADSTHALYYTFDVATGANSLFAASLAGDNRRLSEGSTEFEHFALAGGAVVFSDNINGSGADLLSTTDIRRVDVDAAALVPETIAVQANNLFFPTHNRRWVVYTSDHDPNAAGLFVAKVR